MNFISKTFDPFLSTILQIEFNTFINNIFQKPLKNGFCLKLGITKVSQFNVSIWHILSYFGIFGK